MFSNYSLPTAILSMQMHGAESTHFVQALRSVLKSSKAFMYDARFLLKGLRSHCLTSSRSCALSNVELNHRIIKIAEDLQNDNGAHTSIAVTVTSTSEIFWGSSSIAVGELSMAMHRREGD
jgi:hypothetical protein